MTLGQRLRDAITNHAGISVRQFHRRMVEQKVSGSSYPTIHRYLADKAEPSLKFLRKAAEVLDVTYEWLAVGVPPKTEAERSFRLALDYEPGYWIAVMAGELVDEPPDEEEEPEWRGVLKGLREGFGSGGARLIGHAMLRATVLGTWAQLMLDGVFGIGEDKSSAEIPYLTGRNLGRVLRAPLDAGEVAPEAMSDREFVEFMTSACQGLRQWPRANRSIQDHSPATEEDDDA